MAMTRRPTSTIGFIGLQATNAIGYYMSQRARGKNHQAAVRALACKWIRIIYSCWQTRTPYSEVKYLESLRKKRSPLLAFAANNPS
jgi:hypothetical protein